MLMVPRCSGAVRIVSAASTGEVLRTARAGTPARASAPVISRGARMAGKMPSPAPEVTGPAARGAAAASRPGAYAPGLAPITTMPSGGTGPSSITPPAPRHSEPIACSSARAASPSRGGVLRCLRQDVPQTAGDRGAALRPAATAQAAASSQAGTAAGSVVAGSIGAPLGSRWGQTADASLLRPRPAVFPPVCRQVGRRWLSWAAREPLRRPQRSTLNRPALYTLRDQQRPPAVITIRNRLPVRTPISPQP